MTLKIKVELFNFKDITILFLRNFVYVTLASIIFRIVTICLVLKTIGNCKVLFYSLVFEKFLKNIFEKLPLLLIIYIYVPGYKYQCCSRTSKESRRSDFLRSDRAPSFAYSRMLIGISYPLKQFSWAELFVNTIYCL